MNRKFETYTTSSEANVNKRTKWFFLSVSVSWEFQRVREGVARERERERVGGGGGRVKRVGIQTDRLRCLYVFVSTVYVIRTDRLATTYRRIYIRTFLSEHPVVRFLL